MITDGLYRWDDIFNPFIRFIEGVEVNGLFKFYENNFFYRSPVVRGSFPCARIPFRSAEPGAGHKGGSLPRGYA